MNKANIVLSGVALAGVAGAAYFAVELGSARQQLATSRAATPGSAPAPLAASAMAGTRPPTPGSPPAAPTPAREPDLKALARAWDVKQIPQWRAILEDPEKREAMARQYREGYLKGNSKMARELGLSDDEFTRLAA